MTNVTRPVASLLAELRAQGVQLAADNERLRVSAPKGVLNDAIRQELASRKSELMAWLAVPPLVPAGRSEPLPLSFAQQRLWFFDQLEGRSAVYNLPSAIRLIGPLDRHALQQSLDALVVRHESLRTTVATDLGRPTQSIQPAASVAMPLVEVSSDSAMHARLLAFTAAPFDLQRDLPIRAMLLREAPDRHVFALVLHHIVADGWSLGTLQRELEVLYRHFVNGSGVRLPLPELPVQYADYAVWQRQWLNGPALEARLAYWRDALAGAPALLHLPSDRPRPALRSEAGGSVRRHLDPERVAAVKGFARAQGATPFMVLLAAFAALLARLSGESDLVIGTSVAGRDRPEIEGLVGFFVNELALRLRCRKTLRFADLVAQAREVTLDAFAHQDLPFQQVVEALRPNRSLSHAPVFQVTCVLQNAASGSLALPGIDVQPVDIAHGGAKFDLSLVAEEQPGGGLRCDFEYSADLFDHATIERWAGHFETLLGSALATPDQPIETLALLRTDERHALIEGWNDTARGFPAETLLPDWFAAQAARTAELPAVIAGSQTIRYRDLASRVHRIARRLIALGVGPDDVVGVCVKRTPDLPAALLGVQAAGAAYVPLDPDYPADRLAYMATDSRAAAIIATRETAPRLPQSATPLILLDDPAEQVRLADLPDAPVAQAERRRPLLPEDLAYVLYTSGSTGRPKGVMVTQRGIVHYIDWSIREFGIGPGRGAPVNTSFAFDATLLTLNAPLYAGAAITLVPEEQELLGLAAALAEHRGFAVVKVTPSHLELLNHIMRPDRADGAAGAFAIGGEPLNGAALAFWRKHAPSLRLCNEYGPTEITVGCSLHTVTRDDPETGPISIGGPNPNYTMHVLDRRLEPVPIGVAGELYIGGVGVSRGYLHRPDMTAERFIPNPFGEGRLYKSGDLVRRRSDGRMEFLSRTDRQVKLRGHRIELGEIEAALQAAPYVTEAAVQIKPDQHGQQRLVAYVGGGDDVPSAAELIRGLSQSLPSYMLPTAVVRMERLPLSPNGKVDYAALPLPDTAEANPDEAQPRNAVERTLCRIWEDVLGRRPIGIHSNFFNLGGDSIVSLQVVARARQAGYRLTPKQLFQHQTIAELAVTAEQAGAADALLEESDGTAPLTPIQRWFFGQHLAEPHHFNQALLLTLASDVDAAMLRAALAALIDRHEALRLRIAGTEAAPHQEIAAQAPREPLSVIDLSNLPEAEQIPTRDAIAAAVNGDFRLNEGLLLRAAWFKFAAGQPNQLLLAIHHLAVDGVSWRILLDDLAAALAALRSDQAVELPAVSVAWTQWARRLARVALTAEEQRYVDGLTAPAPLPRDRDGEPGTEADARSVSFRLTRGQTTALLEEANRAYRTQVPDLLLAALALALQGWTGSSGHVVDLEGHGREEIVEGIDLSRTVGWFTTLYPVHLRADRAANPGAAIAEIRQALRAVPRGGLGFGLRHWGASATEAAPRAEIVFNYLGQWSFASPEGGGIVAVDAGPGPLRSPRSRRAHALAIDAYVRDGMLAVELEYDGRRWHSATIDSLAQEFATRLEAILAHCADPASWVRVPADFPLAQLTPAGLDRLLRQPFVVEDILPTTPMQQGMLFHAELAEGSDIWFEQMALTIRGNLDGESFRAAWAAMVQRHAVLRGSFAHDERERPLMLIAADPALEWHADDWSDLSPIEQRARADAYLADSRARGFVLDRPPLLRFALIRMAPDRHWFVFNHAHLLLDGWSVPVLFREAFEAYAAIAAGRAPALPPARPFRAYLEWLAARGREETRDFWRAELAGLSAPTLLAGGPRPGDAGGAKHETHAALPPDATVRLESFARERRLTIATIVQAAWAILLARYSGETDVLFGATVSGRPAELPGIERMVGLFVNTLPVHATVDPDARLVPWLIDLQDRQQQREAHASVSLVDIHGWSEIPASLPLFETAIAFENYPADVATEGGSAGLAVDDVQVTLEATNYPLAIQVVMGRALEVKLTYDSERFPAALITQIAEHFTRLLSILPANPEATLDEYDLDPPERQRALAAAWTDNAQHVADSLQQALAKSAADGSEPIRLPIANTQVYLLDRRLRIVPDGAPGEICIAGDGLASGGHAAAELISECLIANPFGPPGSRMYRTGSFGRRRPDGTIEFLGRRDHQIKLRGYHIQAGEVEAALRAQPGVRDAAVAAHGSAGNAALVGYVVPAFTDADIAAAAAEQAEQSKAMFDGIYSNGAAPDPTFDIRGWTDSATREQVPEAEMREWVDSTVARLRAFGARRVLEIGCGTGLILSRLAPGTTSYVATEISQEALAAVGDLVAQQPGLGHVVLRRQEAIDFTGIADGSFDLCILNSVVQYFPSRDYLCQVIQQALRALTPNGVLFIGDVRSLPLLELFHAHVLRRRGADGLDRTGVARRVRRAVVEEEELVLDPGFFAGFGSDCRIALKRGSGHNEITLFRYDVTIHAAPVPALAPGFVRHGAASLVELEAELTCAAADCVLVRGIANRRLAEDRAVIAWRDGAGDAASLGAVRAQPVPEQSGLDPEAVYRLGERFGYDVALSWSSDGPPGSFDAAFRRGGDAALLLPPPRAANPDANIPQFGRLGRRLIADLRRTLRDRLPDYMVPSHWVVLDALPLTSSGKIDRRALAAPDDIATAQQHVAARSPEEEVIAGIWADILGRDTLGVDEDFFLLGGHSLLATQAIARIRTAFNIDVPLKWLFESPTVAALAARIAAARGHRVMAPIVARPPDAPLVLSFSQRRLWFLHRLEGPSATYNTPGAFELNGALDRPALAAALQHIVQRHVVLRTIFPAVDGEPRPEIMTGDRFVLREVDLVAADAREADLAELIAGEAAHPFDIAIELPFRALLIRLSPRRHVLAVTMHHIVSDLWSIAIFARELAALYAAAREGRDAQLPPQPLSFFDYAAWQQETAADAAMAESVAWWRRSLEGAPPALELPLDRPRPAKTGLRAAAAPVALSPAVAAALESLSRGAGATLFMTLLAGFALLLGRQAGQDTVVLGTPIAGRTRSETEGLIGFFVNTLALRVDLPGSLSVRDLIAQVRLTALDAFANQEVPFDRLVEELNPPRQLGRSPIFQAMFVWQNVPPAQIGLPGLSVTPIAPPLQAPKFELTLVLEPGDTGITGQLEYDADLFDQDTVDRWARRLERLWQDMAAAPERAVFDLLAADAADRHRLIGLGRGPSQDVAQATIVDAIRAAASRWPDAVAVEADGMALRYADLLRRAEQLARRLLAEGVAPEEVIGVWADRGLTAAVGFLGVLLAGCAYLPLDRNLPAERLETMRRRAGVRRVLDLAEAEAAASSDGSLPQLSSERLAYVIYTSGSTGEPKGVMVPHGGLLNLALAQVDLLGLDHGSRLLRFVAPVFDVAVGEMASVLAAGGTLVELGGAGMLPGDELVDLLADQRISHLQVTASTLPALPRRALPDLSVLVVGGEACAPEVAQWWAQGRRLINAYGPTEASVCAVATELRSFEGRLPLGRPLPNVAAYVLDARLRPVEEGIAGELWLGGAGVARGYVGRAEQTAERFIPDPFGPLGSRMYRTGDLVRWRGDGQLEFLGRQDGQMKLRGYRIEQGEVEAALLSHPGVREAAVLARDAGLIAYVAGELDLAALRAHVEARLPTYMVPAPIVRLDALPRTAGGKLDRRSLPEPAASAMEGTPPAGETECGLAALWSELLGTQNIGRESHFFALGGHSLLAARLQARVQARFQVPLPLRMVFEAPTLAGLAAAIDVAHLSQSAEDGAASAIPILRRERRGRSDAAGHA